MDAHRATDGRTVFISVYQRLSAWISGLKSSLPLSAFFAFSVANHPRPHPCHPWLKNFFVRNPAPFAMQGMKALPGEQTQRVPPCGTAPRHRPRLPRRMGKRLHSRQRHLRERLLPQHSRPLLVHHAELPFHAQLPQLLDRRKFRLRLSQPLRGGPSVGVRGSTRSNGTYVSPHVRTAPNHTVTDNLSYRGYGKVPLELRALVDSRQRFLPA